MNAVCAHCGSRVKAGAEKCPNCGATQLEPAGSEAPRVAKSRTGLGLVAGLLGSLLFALSGAVVWLLLAPSAPPSQPEARRSPDAAPTGWAAVRGRGQLRVGVDPDAPPFLKKSGDSWEGFEYAVISAIGEQAKVPVELVPVPYDDLLGEVAAGRVDLAVAQLPPQPHDGVAFSRSYLQYTLCLVVRSDQSVSRLSDLKGARIGLYRDPTAQAALQANGSFQTRFYEDSGYFSDLAAGELEGVLYDCPLARYELRADPAGARLRVADDHVDVATYSVAVTTQIPRLREDVDAVLTDLGTSGLLQPLARRWLGEEPPGDFQGAASRVVAVQGGEDLSAVAARAGVGAAQLAAWNEDILGSGPPALYAGLLLRVR